MKNYVKAVSVIACVTAVCVAILAVVNKFWYVAPPDKTNETIVEILDDPSVTFEKLDRAQFGANPAVLNIYKVTSGSNEGVHLIHTRTTNLYATAEVLTAIEKDGSAVIKIGILYFKSSGGDYDMPLTGIDMFSGKDPNTMRATDLPMLPSPSSATFSADSIYSAVVIAFEFYGTEVLGNEADPTEVRVAKKLFGNTVEEVNELEELANTELKIRVFEVVLANEEIHKMYYAYDQTYDYDDGPNNEMISIYAGINLNTHCWSGVEYELKNNAYSPKVALIEAFNASENMVVDQAAILEIDESLYTGSATGSGMAVLTLLYRIAGFHLAPSV